MNVVATVMGILGLGIGLFAAWQYDPPERLLILVGLLLVQSFWLRMPMK